MTAPSTSWTCASCGGLNYGTQPKCILCSAPSPYASGGAGGQRTAQPSPQTTPKTSGFCGECGAPLVPGVQFCGECGARTPSAASSPPPRQRPVETPPQPRQPPPQQGSGPPHQPYPPPQQQPRQHQPPQPQHPPPQQQHQPQQQGVFCPSCGKNNKPTAAFCRSCGAGLRGQPSAVARNIVNPGPPSPPVQSRPTGPDGRENAPVTQKKPGVGSKLMKALIQNAVSIATMIVTYYLTSKFAASSLQAQFGDMGRQLGPAIISLAVGGVSRTFLQSVMK